MSQRLYKQLITPMNSEKYCNPTPSNRKNNPTIIPMKKTVMTRVSQFLAQKSVARRQPTINAETILDASKLNPDITITAPMNELPKYPAGIVQHHFPPLIFVKPPSSGSTVIDSTFAPVSSPANACENSWRATVINLNGYSMSFKYAMFHNSTIATM